MVDDDSNVCCIFGVKSSVKSRAAMDLTCTACYIVVDEAFTYKTCKRLSKPLSRQINVLLDRKTSSV